MKAGLNTLSIHFAIKATGDNVINPTLKQLVGGQTQQQTGRSTGICMDQQNRTTTSKLTTNRTITNEITTSKTTIGETMTSSRDITTRILTGNSSAKTKPDRSTGYNQVRILGLNICGLNRKLNLGIFNDYIKKN